MDIRCVARRPGHPERTRRLLLLGLFSLIALLLAGCSDSSSSGNKDLSVSTPVISLTADPLSISANDFTTLTWSVTNGASCEASGAWSGSKPMSGRETVGPLTTTSTFILTCSDAAGDANQSVTVTVEPSGNQAPVANNDSVTTEQDVALIIDVLANDTDSNTGDTLTVSSVMQPTNGSAVNNNTNVTYTPNTGFSGTDTFTYIATDGTSGSNSATVTVTVTAPPSNGNFIRIPQDFPTIRAGINAAQDGDVVLISPGTYEEDTIIRINKDITIASQFFTTGDPSFINNTTIMGDPSNILFEVIDHANVSIIGLTIERARKPIVIEIGNGIIKNNRIINCESDGISFEGDSSGVAQDNFISNPSGDDGIDIDGLRGPYLIKGNTIIGNKDDGIEMRLIDSYLTSGPIEYTITDNFIEGNLGGDGIQLIDYPDDTENRRVFYIQNNVLINNRYSGVGTMPDTMTKRGSLPNGDPYPDVEVLERVFLINNTFVGNDVGIAGGNNFVVLNNIITGHNVGATHVDGSGNQRSIIDHTLFWDNGVDFDDVPSENQGNDILFNNPQLDANFELGTISPAIDAGTARYDWNGETVLNLPASAYAGAAPDLGWKESGFTPP